MSYKIAFDGIGVNPACAEFTADTLAHAQTVAQVVATLLQRTVYLCGISSSGPPFTAYTPAAPGTALGTSTGISF